MEPVTITRALISVSDKTGLVEFASALAARDVEILATGGTYAQLKDAGIAVTEVAEHTGFPEMMDGRVKTLHPKIHGGLLGRRNLESGTGDEAVMAEHGIAPIDLVVVNLYPFESVVAQPDCDLREAIENIDIGGPAMVRSAAKNHNAVTVLVDVNDYATLLEEMAASDGAVSGETRFRMAVKAFARIAEYDAAIANYLGAMNAAGEREQRYPSTFTLHLEKVAEMRYGENPHQGAAFYREPGAGGGTVAGAEQLQGRELSYNNIADADAALACVKSFADPACVIVKHANPCGVAVADSLLDAYLAANATDPESAYGGIIAFNRPLDAKTVSEIIERQFAEVIIAPSVAKEALEAAAARRNMRVLACGEFGESAGDNLDFKRVDGGLLIQDSDRTDETGKALEVVTTRAPDDAELADLLFAWRVVKFVKSNAIVYAKGGRTLGIGAGQMSRVFSARIAALKAADQDLEIAGSVMASDAFFPFRDGIDAAAEAGITAVIQPGGSIRDEEVIAAANEATIAMVFTGVRHFRH